MQAWTGAEITGDTAEHQVQDQLCRWLPGPGAGDPLVGEEDPQ